MTTTDKDARKIEEARQALLAYIRTGNMRAAGREIRVSKTEISRRVEDARKFIKAGKMTVDCQIIH